jgi:hypothetical protein
MEIVQRLPAICFRPNAATIESRARLKWMSARGESARAAGPSGEERRAECRTVGWPGGGVCRGVLPGYVCPADDAGRASGREHN